MQRFFAAAPRTIRGAASMPSKRTLATKSTTMSSMRSVHVGNTADWPCGTMKECPVGNGENVLVMRTRDGALYATSPKCTHYGAPLVKGVLSGHRVTCPWHGACFNAKTGDIEDGPVLDALVSYEVEVKKNGRIYVSVPEGEKLTRRVPCSHAAASSPEHAVVVGGGPASAAAVESMRQHGFTGEITLISKEPLLPYDRIKASKDMNVSGPDIQLRSAEFYEGLGVKTRLGTEVERVDVSERADGRGVLHLTGGETVPYDKLLLCTGGAPRRFLPSERITIPGADLGRIMPMRSVQDANAFTALLKDTGGDVVILGSSFIGMEAAAFLASGKAEGVKSVTVVGMEVVPLQRVLSLEVGQMIERMHKDHGVQFYNNRTIEEFLPSETDPTVCGAVRLDSGEVLPAAAVIIGAGVTPATGMLHGVELARDGSVPVDKTLRVNGTENVWAAGDIARFPSSLADGETARVEHWDVAMDQGRVAGANMAGKSMPYDNVPFFWTVQYGKSIRYAGHATKVDLAYVAKGDDSFCAYLVKNTDAGPKVVAVTTKNADPVAVAAHALMRMNAMPSADELVGQKLFDFLPNYLAKKEREAALAEEPTPKVLCSNM